MHERKQRFTDLSDGFVTIPGGVGTMDELWEAMSWAQLGYHDNPVGLLNAFGFYDELIAFNRKMAEVGFVRPVHQGILVARHHARRADRQDGRLRAAYSDLPDEGRRPLSTPRPLVQSRYLRPTVRPRRAAGATGRALVAKSLDAIEQGSHSFAAASKLFDKPTRERSWLLYAWCRRCDDIADNQDKGGPLGDQGTPKDAEDRVQALRVLTKRAFEEQPTADAAFDAFGLVADECGLTLEEANDVIAGFALDATRWSPQDRSRHAALLLPCGGRGRAS